MDVNNTYIEISDEVFDQLKFEILSDLESFLFPHFASHCEEQSIGFLTDDIIHISEIFMHIKYLQIE